MKKVGFTLLGTTVACLNSDLQLSQNVFYFACVWVLETLFITSYRKIPGTGAALVHLCAYYPGDMALRVRTENKYISQVVRLTYYQISIYIT